MSQLIALKDAGRFLAWINGAQRKDLSEFSGVDAYVIVGLAALARQEMSAPIDVVVGDNPVAQFARAVGLPEVMEGKSRSEAIETERTVRLARFGWHEAHEVEPLARDIAQLMTRQLGTPQFDAVKYVIIELLRNVAQHSQDKLGGVVAAQVIDRPGVSRRVQVAVADAGIGVLKGLTGKGLHPGLTDIRIALEKALHPHFSGTFPEGQTGTAENAGLGLYVLSELAKMTGGSFLLASRGDGLLIQDSTDPAERAGFVNSGGYPGTLVVFECVLESLSDFNQLFKRIRDNADQRKPARATGGIVQFSTTSPKDSKRFLVSVASEDTAAAVAFSKTQLLPLVSTGQAITLDFTNWSVFSQSYVHSLLYTVIRVAWATKAPIHVLNASPAVRSAIEWVESYALGG